MHPLCASVHPQQNSDSVSCQQMTDYFVYNLTYRIEELTLGKLDVVLIVFTLEYLDGISMLSSSHGQFGTFMVNI